MGVGFRVGNITTEVGTSEFLHSFFSTISVHLEPAGWGSRFPELLNALYQGNLPVAHCDKVTSDLQIIRAELAAIAPDRVVWDIDDPNAEPPWGRNISDGITSLANYFVTSGGRDLFDVLLECLEYQKRKELDMTIVRTPPRGPHSDVRIEFGTKNPPDS